MPGRLRHEVREPHVPPCCPTRGLRDDQCRSLPSRSIRHLPSRGVDNRPQHCHRECRPAKSCASSATSQNDCERSEEHTSELQSLMRISYAVFCLQKKIIHNTTTQ